MARVYRRWLALCALVLLVGACGRDAQLLPRLAQDDVIVAFGDSLTFGTGASEAQSYPAVLSELIGREVVRAGVPGETTEGALARLPEVLEAHKPRILLLCSGGNDMLARRAEPDIAANLRAMIELARAHGSAVVLIGVPKPALLSDPPKLYQRLAKEFSLAYQGSVLKKVLYSPEMKADPIHPNAAGYRLMATELAKLLRAHGAL